MTKEVNNKDDARQAILTVGDAVIGAAILLVIGVYAGSYLDGIFHTSPWLSFTLSILGGGLGLARMVIKAQELDKTPKKTDK